MSYINRSIEIEAPPATILQVLQDIEAYPSWQLAVREAEVLERDAQGRATLARLDIAVETQTATCTILISYLELNRFEYFVTESDVIRRNDTSYTVAVQPAGTSLVSCNMGIDIAWDLSEEQIDQLASGAIEALLDGLKLTAEKLA